VGTNNKYQSGTAIEEAKAHHKDAAQGDRMRLTGRGQIFALLSIGLLAAPLAEAVSFGTLAFKDKVTLVRKLPAAVHLTGATIKVKVTGHDDQSDLIHDLEGLHETELLKGSTTLRPMRLRLQLHSPIPQSAVLQPRMCACSPPVRRQPEISRKA
jgi:hypothetical protein